MKRFKLLRMFLPLMVLLTSCGGGGDDEIINGDITVTIGENGEVSNGGTFVRIDDKTFYLDYIKYSVEEGHLIVSGYDEKGFNGITRIASRINYKENSYEVLEIRKRAFEGCNILTSLTIPNSVTTIGHYAFANCIGLT